MNVNVCGARLRAIIYLKSHLRAINAPIHKYMWHLGKYLHLYTLICSSTKADKSVHARRRYSVEWAWFRTKTLLQNTVRSYWTLLKHTKAQCNCSGNAVAENAPGVYVAHINCVNSDETNTRLSPRKVHSATKENGRVLYEKCMFMCKFSATSSTRMATRSRKLDRRHLSWT